MGGPLRLPSSHAHKLFFCFLKLYSEDTSCNPLNWCHSSLMGHDRQTREPAIESTVKPVETSTPVPDCRTWTLLPPLSICELQNACFSDVLSSVNSSYFIKLLWVLNDLMHITCLNWWRSYNKYSMSIS